jgi:hypothetical protein
MIKVKIKNKSHIPRGQAPNSQQKYLHVECILETTDTKTSF